MSRRILPDKVGTCPLLIELLKIWSQTIKLSGKNLEGYFDSGQRGESLTQNIKTGQLLNGGYQLIFCERKGIYT